MSFLQDGPGRSRSFASPPQFLVDDRRRRQLGLALLALAVVGSSVLILEFAHGQSFVADDWGFLIGRRSFTPDNIFHPWGGHLIAAGLIVYDALYATVGITSHLPYELATMVVRAVIGVLIYVLARRRVGDLWAVAPAAVMLFFGAGWDLLIPGSVLPNEIGLAAGLGAFACLDRGDLRGDVAASVLLGLSLASFSISLPIALGVAVEVTIARRQCRYRRAWVYLAPLALYAIWWAWARQFHDLQVVYSNIGSAPTSMFEELAAVCAAVTGLFRSPGATVDIGDALSVHPEFGRPLAFLLIGAVILRLRYQPRPGPRFWALIAIIVANLFAISMVLSPSRVPNAGRYVWLTSVFVLLLLAELSVGLRWRPWQQLAVAAVVVFSLTANISNLDLGGSYFQREAQYNRSELAALELVRGRISPDFVPEIFPNQSLPHPDLGFSAADYFELIDDLGSPAYSPAELAAAPAPAREAADQMLGRALRIRAQPVRRLPDGNGAPLTPGSASRLASVRKVGDCVAVRPELGRVGELSMNLPPGGFAYRAPRDAEVSVRFGRFGDGLAVAAAPVNGSAVVRIPTDRSARPWRAAISSDSPLSACPL